MKTRKESNTNKMAGIITYFQYGHRIYGLNSPIKGHRIVWIKKQDLTIFCLQEMCITERKNKHWLRVKG
jgi:hypothetical protein